MSDKFIVYRTPVVLLLDSGVGGLFVYNLLRQKYPWVQYLYFFDNKFFPYGERSVKFITQRVIFIIDFMWNRYNFDLVVIACNTISVVALQVLKTLFLFPIIGIIPNIQLASKCTKNGVIGVVATRCTIQNSYILNLIKRFASHYKVILLGASELVELAEDKMCGKKILKSVLHNIFESWFKLSQFPDTIVLGCTHFSLLREDLLKIFPKNSHLIDSKVDINFCLEKSVCNFYKMKSNRKSFKNKAYCSIDTIYLERLRSVLLLNYNFISLETLFI